MEWYQAAVAVVGGAAGWLGTAAAARLVRNWLALRSGNAAITTTQRRDVQDEQQTLIAIQQAEIDRLLKRVESKERETESRERDRDARLRRAEEAEAECREMYGRAEERITLLEDSLRAAGIEVRRPWVRPSPGSGRHPRPEGGA